MVGLPSWDAAATIGGRGTLGRSVPGSVGAAGLLDQPGRLPLAVAKAESRLKQVEGSCSWHGDCSPLVKSSFVTRSPRCLG